MKTTAPQREKRRPGPKELANLRPFQPGQSGNPGGRPKTKILTDALRLHLDEKDKAGVTNAEKLARALVARALTGDVSAYREICDRVEGKSPLEADVRVFDRQHLETLWRDLVTDAERTLK